MAEPHSLEQILRAIDAKIPSLAESQEGLHAAIDAYFHAAQLASVVSGTRADLVELRATVLRLEATLLALLPHLPTDAPPLPPAIAAAATARRQSRARWNAIVGAVLRGDAIDLDRALAELAALDAAARAALAAAAGTTTPAG